MPAGEFALVQHEVQTLYSNHHGWLHAWLRKKLGCSHNAADLAHDTFVRLLSRREPVAAAEPRAYLATIAHGLVVDFHRRRALERAYLDTLAALPEPQLPSLEARAIVLEALVAIDTMLDGMKPPVRQAFMLSQLDGLTYAEIAARLGVTVRTVNNYMLKALEHCHARAVVMKSGFELTPDGIGAPSRSEAEVRKEAIAWYARLCSGDATEADRENWRRWHRAHPDHQRAWQRFEAMQATFKRVPAHVAASTLRAAHADRRRVLRGIAVLAGGGSLAYASWQVAGTDGGWRAWLADYRTGTGEQRSVTLADGSLLKLNTRTSVDVSIDATHRLVTLREGEILAETARHRGLPGAARIDSRPFLVATPHGRILALGTRFTVRSDGARTVVSVLEDAVEVRASHAPGNVVRLEAGQQVAFTGDSVDAPQPADPALADWEHGSLVVNDWRLGDVVAELARYHRGRLACDPAVADIRVSGAFPVMDTGKALAVIVRAFPVRVSGLTRYWVSLVPA